MIKVKLLPNNVIKQIAAGEVVESPYSVVKELVENSIDASPTNIEISIRNGGKSFISVLDDGDGIHKEDLRNTLFKHTTSKLDSLDLYNIRTMGFRGEALFSIAYMSKILIKSKEKNSTEAYEVYAENDYVGNIKPTSFHQKQGTYIEVRDLFFSFPARLKFMKSDISEANAIYKVIDNLAMANPNIGFTVFNNGKKIIEYKRNTKHLTCKNFYETMKESLQSRLAEVLGKTFTDNSLFIYTPSVDFVIYGYVSIPTYNVHNSSKQYFFVNKRYVKEKNFFGMIKSAYAGVIESSRHPIVAIFIDINPEAIDVNVSPSKTEIKFRDIEQIKKFIVGSMKSAISDPKMQKTSSLLPQSLIHTMNKVGVKKVLPDYNSKPTKLNEIEYVDYSFGSEGIPLNSDQKNINKSNDKHLKNESNSIDSIEKNQNHIESSVNNEFIFNNSDTLFEEYKLGYAKAQYNKNWVIAESSKGLVIVDQHAAHERITQERLYNQFINNKVITNILMIPEVIKIPPKDLEILMLFKNNLCKLGLVIDNFGDNAIIVREYPSILNNSINFKDLVYAILLELKDIESTEYFLKKLRAVITKIACHNSVRSGEELSITEMNELLRQIERTENSAECPHGRPTYTVLDWKYIEKLFNRR